MKVKEDQGETELGKYKQKERSKSLWNITACYEHLRKSAKKAVQNFLSYSKSETNMTVAFIQFSIKEAINK